MPFFDIFEKCSIVRTFLKNVSKNDVLNRLKLPAVDVTKKSYTRKKSAVSKISYETAPSLENLCLLRPTFCDFLILNHFL